MVGLVSIDLIITQETVGILEWFFRHLLYVPIKDAYTGSFR